MDQTWISTPEKTLSPKKQLTTSKTFLFWDSGPTLVEFSKAIDALTNRKAPGEDNKPPEMIKYGKSAPLEPFHKP